MHDVVLAELARAPGTHRTLAITRLQYMAFGDGPLAAICAAAILLAVIVAGFALVRRRFTTFDVFALAGMVTISGWEVQFSIATYYNRFAAMVVPFVALPLGIAVGRLAVRRPRWVAAAVAAALVLVLISVVPRFAAELRPAMAGRGGRGGAAGRLRALLALSAHGDERPLHLRRSRLHPDGRSVRNRPGPDRNDPRGLERTFQAALHHTDYLVASTTLVHALWGSSLAPVRSYVTDHFRLVRDGPIYVYVRDGFRVG